DLTVRAQVKVQRVAPINQHESRLQQVVAVRTPPSDVQKEIKFGRGRYVVERLHGGII
ncbi:MAG: hypothetical protein RL032_1634, partial [Pseudomonadota bacterium]